MRRWALGWGLTTTLLAACGGSSSAGSSGSDPAPTASPQASVVTAAVPTVQEQQCQALGWQREVVQSVGLARLVLWKAPAGNTWTRGAMLVLHGGGGTHTNFCVANVALTEPQVRFTAQALAAGYAVFLLDSSDRVTDPQGRLCGKVWDDSVNTRDNLDLPFLESVMQDLIPAKRPVGSRGTIVMTGLSSGGFMSLRAATRLGHLLSAVAPVSSGDPYGWARDCTPLPADRSNVFGYAFDLETRQPISQPAACQANAYPNEKPWDASPGNVRPPIRQFHHVSDAIHDVSCVEKASIQLTARGFSPAPPFRLSGPPREAAWHYWLDDYNPALLDYFAGFTR